VCVVVADHVRLVPPVSSASLERGCRVGPCEIHEEIGRGNSAAVYRAHDLETGEEIALKWLVDVRDAQQLKREFRIARSLSHRHLVRLHELHRSDRGTFFTMDLVRGPGLLERCRAAGPHGSAAHLEIVRALFGELADGLAYLHAAAVVHRDIKPGNVLVGHDDHVVLVDFGLAQPVDVAAPWVDTVSGTLAYLAPERFGGQPASPASDWFSFGVLLFEALAGELPFGDAGATAAAWFSGQRVERIEARVPDAAADLVPLLEGLLAPAPGTRSDATHVFEVLGCHPSWAVAHALVGRHVEQARLEALATRPVEAPTLLAIVGESGLGKTRLARAVGNSLRRRGHVVLGSRCHPREHVPFNALDGVAAELLSRLDRHACVSDEVATARSIVERAFSPVAMAVPESTPVGLARAMVSLLRASAEGRRIFVWIDDVQWADEDSLALLEHVLDAEGLSLCCLVTARGSLPNVPPSLRDRLGEVLELSRLDATSSHALLHHLLPGIAEHRAEAICRVADGHPLALEQAAGLERTQPVHLPATLPELLLARVQRRDPTHRELLALLAVHEGPLPTEIVAACPEVSPRSAYDLLDAGLVELHRHETTMTVALRHARLASTVYATLSDAEVAVRHGRLADAFASVRPEDAEPRFGHLVAAGRIDEALEPGLRAARRFRDALAFHRATERLRWLIAHADTPSRARSFGLELADVLGRSGAAREAGEAYFEASEGASVERRLELHRLAAEQFLRAGDVGRGRQLLATCMKDAGLALPRTFGRQILALVLRRLRVRARWSTPTAGREAGREDRRIEIAWSAGLGLNMVDIITSALAQAQFTDLALRHGNPSQVGRALAVEYSYTMNAGGWRAEHRGRRLRARLDSFLDGDADTYTKSMMRLSWAAGDYFRGDLSQVLPRVRAARRGFASMLGAGSWELANCGLYETWTLLELGELEVFVEGVWSALEHGDARGDVLYRQCFVGGYGATAWLIAGRPEALRDRLETLDRTATDPRFQMADFFALLAKVRLDLYTEPRRAWPRMKAAWPEIRRSGFTRLRWFALTLRVLLVQAALAVPDDPEARRVAERALRALATSDHPAASGWAATLRAGLERDQDAAVDALRRGIAAFEAAGFRLAADAARHRLHQAGVGEPPAWPGAVVDPERLVTAVGLPCPIRGA
jgi:eukaryotic-like serine/threonine-protein kinase